MKTVTVNGVTTVVDQKQVPIPELTIKDLWDGGKYDVKMLDTRGRETGKVTFQVAEKKEESDG